MAEAELHRERLQAIAEKRKRQAAIEDKRQQLEDQILQLQHLKSKSLREKWLMQGAPAGSKEEEEARKRQCEEDEQRLKILEENVQRLEQDILQLESEESLLSAKEQVLREKLKETEVSLVDLQKSLSNQEKADAVNYIYSQIPDLTNLYSHHQDPSLDGDRTAKAPALYAMEINVEKDRNTGETKILSTSAIDPEVVHQRGIKVYDDGSKVVYELHHAGAVVENGVHKLSSRDVDDLLQKSTQSNIVAGQDILPKRTFTSEGISSHMKEQLHFKEAKLEMVHKPTKGFPLKPGLQHVRSGVDVVEPTLEQPVTMIFMGYQNIDDDEETKKVLGYDDTMKAELVLIDEDDEKSLREKTVTDLSIMDGNAAELVSGKLLTETTEPSSPDGKEESLATEPITDSKKKSVQFKDFEDPEEIEDSFVQPNKPPISEDEITLKKEKEQISANHLQPVDILLTSNDTMDCQVQVSEPKGVTVVSPDVLTDHQSILLSAAVSHNGLKDRHESLDSDVAKELQYLDEVLEANCCDSAADNSFNGSTSPEQISAITVDGSGPSVSVTNDCSTIQMDIIAGDHKPLPAVDINESIESTEPVKINGHSQEEMKDDHSDVFTYPASPNSSNSSRRSSKDGDSFPKVIKKEAKFELRAFHEEKKPAKLFDDFNEKEHIRVRKVRPSEEVVELEKERLELIRSQAVKKNPGIATKWWNPPQEKPLEEQLASDQLESHLKYKERKQKLQHGMSLPTFKSAPTPMLPSEIPAVNKEHIVTEQIDFSAARKQFLNMENTSQTNKAPPRRSVSSNFFSVKPFYKVNSENKLQSSPPPTNPFNEYIDTVRPEDILPVKAEKVVPEDQQWLNQTPESPGDQFVKYLTEDLNDFDRASAKMTIVKDDDDGFQERFIKSVTVSSAPEELDSGLDDLSVKSQDTTVMETLSNDFSMDNISDSGTSNETINTLHEHSLGEFSQPQTPLHDDYSMGGVSKSFSDQGFYSPSSMLCDSNVSEDQIEYQAGVLVQSVIQQALAEKAGISDYPDHTPVSTEIIDTCERDIEQKVIVSESTEPLQDHTVFEPPQESSSMQDVGTVRARPKISEQKPRSWQEKAPEPLCITQVANEESAEEIQQESYFSKYSQAAELRSTASIASTQESEITVGPFKLRSKKQKTLSMIEEEIRAAQEREQELKKQRQRQSLQSPHSPSNKNVPVMPTRTASYRTAPGKIEKVKTPSSPKGESFPIQPDDLLDDGNGSQRPRNLMQTLMDDYETHKNKVRDRRDDSTVLEAVRVNRRKSALALRWEAGIYANREDDE